MVEPAAYNRQVVGSIPTRGTNTEQGGKKMSRDWHPNADLKISCWLFGGISTFSFLVTFAVSLVVPDKVPISTPAVILMVGVVFTGFLLAALYEFSWVRFKTERVRSKIKASKEQVRLLAEYKELKTKLNIQDGKLSRVD